MAKSPFEHITDTVQSLANPPVTIHVTEHSSPTLNPPDSNLTTQLQTNLGHIHFYIYTHLLDSTYAFIGLYHMHLLHIVATCLGSCTFRSSPNNCLQCEVLADVPNEVTL